MQAYAFSLNSNSSIVGLQILPPPLTERQSFHLALLLDTSTSMAGARLHSVKQTLHSVISHMQPTDALTLIEYNSATTILCKSLSDKEQLTEITNSLKARAATNLEKAILQFPDDIQPDCICILTDGDNTEGLSGTQELQFLAKRKLPSGVPMCCLGYGDDHNEDLLQSLAVQTRGSYTFMHNDEMVPVGVGTVLGSLETEVAKAATLSLKEGVKCLETMPSDSNSFLIGSLFAEKPQWILLDVQNRSDPLWVQWNSRKTGEVCSFSVPIQIPEDENENADVKEQYMRIQCLNFMNDTKTILKKFQVTRYSDQIQKGKNLQTEMENSSISDRPLLIRMQAQISELVKRLEECASAASSTSLPFPTHPPFGVRFPLERQQNAFLTRLTSDMTTFTVQRGILSAVSAVDADDPSNAQGDLYCTPVQRRVTGAITQGYHSQVHDV